MTATDAHPFARPTDLPQDWIAAAIAAAPHLTQAIADQIRAEVPEYAADPTGIISADTQRSVNEAFRMFLQRLAHGGEGGVDLGSLFRRLGRAEAEAGRSHDTLQCAYRIASQAVMHQVLAWERDLDAPPEAIAQLSSAIFAFIDELARLSGEGFASAQEHADDDARSRARLLTLLLDRSRERRAASVPLGISLDVQLPREAAIAEIIGLGARGCASLARLVRRAFGDRALAAETSGRHLVLVVDPVDDASVAAALGVADSSAWISLGSRVPIDDLAHSARWAARAAVLRERGLLDSGPVLRCDDHLITLVRSGDPHLNRVLENRRLAPLQALSAAKRLMYGRLLSAWLELGTTHADVPDVFDVPRTTLHHRIAQLQSMFGPQLEDRNARLELMLALRAVLPRWQREAEHLDRRRTAPDRKRLAAKVPTARNSDLGARNPCHLDPPVRSVDRASLPSLASDSSFNPDSESGTA